VSDRELLELAARAAGLRVAYWHDDWAERDSEYRYGTAIVEGSDGKRQQHWNPLADDGDALRLAVKIELQLRLRHSENEVSVYGSPEGRIDEGVRGDPDAATRRAIVRAAAEIGKAMPA
jgi:hypothetical protein